ncbi:VWA domain-containing protein [Heliophilum fasciatum]|uniref:von Willebrand factor type A domain-containing protein n=1 Tax=Heliophilum fasciatum TaxID=35700 RepID=A0A4R2RDY8_9FIRM|nr:VWA domain-containing protein [Heliophilum fasciatum]MCW2279364.1 hypothetical protein [Heliophilum fasciatum]TCP60207.1 hypothetical protein EDD73_14014 [Heliophilum fasciatum]
MKLQKIRLWKRGCWLAAGLMLTLLMSLLTGCNGENLEKAQGEMMRNETTKPPAVCVLFDNSPSFQDYAESSLTEIKMVFQVLARQYPDSTVSLVLINEEPVNVFSGEAKRLDIAYQELSQVVNGDRSHASNLSAAVHNGSYFLQNADAGRRIMLIFSDMQHTVPDYYPNGSPDGRVPVPEAFPWDDIKDMEVYAVHVSFNEWELWQQEIAKRNMGEHFRPLFPEQMKANHVVNVVFPKTED